MIKIKLARTSLIFWCNIPKIQGYILIYLHENGVHRSQVLLAQGQPQEKISYGQQQRHIMNPNFAKKVKKEIDGFLKVGFIYSIDNIM